MTVRFGGDRTPTLQLFAELSRSNNLEVQQRAGEMLQLLQMEGVGEQLLAPIAAIADTDIDEKAVTINDQPGSAKEDDDLLSLIALGNSQQKPQTTSPSADPLDLLGLGTPSQTAKPTQPTPKPVQNPIANLLGEPDQAAPAPAKPKPASSPVPQGTKMAELTDIVLYGQVKPNPSDPRQFALKLSAYCKSARDLTGYKIALQASQGWQIKCQPQDGNVIGGNYSKPVSNIVYLFNQAGTPFSLNVKIF